MARAETTDEVKLILALGLTPGVTLTWEAILEVLPHLTRGDRRLRTVCRAVKRYAEKWNNLKIRTKPGVGLYVLHHRERAGDVVTTVGRTQPSLPRRVRMRPIFRS